jgi:hypothetical protein
MRRKEVDVVAVATAAMIASTLGITFETAWAQAAAAGGGGAPGGAASGAAAPGATGTSGAPSAPTACARAKSDKS